MIAIIDIRQTETDVLKSGDVLVVMRDDSPLGAMERSHAIQWDDPDLEAELETRDDENPKIAYPYEVSETIDLGSADELPELAPKIRVVVARSSVGVVVDSIPASRRGEMTIRTSTSDPLPLDDYQIEARTIISQGGDRLDSRQYGGSKLGND